MDSWSHEHELYSVALDIMREEGLHRWLCEQYDRLSVLHGLVRVYGFCCAGVEARLDPGAR